MSVRFRNEFVQQDSAPVLTDRCEECDRVIPAGHSVCDNCAAYIAGAYFFDNAMRDNELEV